MGTSHCQRSRRFASPPRVAVRWLLAPAMATLVVVGGQAWAVHPESPEVRRLVEEGLAAIATPEYESDDRYAAQLGGKCVIALAFVKADKRNHPRVTDAINACRAAMDGSTLVDVYSNGLAIVFLTELGPTRYRREIQWYLDLLRQRQKAHGGWGYDGKNLENYDWATGDTSQTQYAALSYWSAYRGGFRIDPQSFERLADWLVRTQDPSGCWGYQGQMAPPGELMPQSQTNCSMLAAGLGSTLICIDLLEAAFPSASGFQVEKEFAFDPEEITGKLPPSVRPAGSSSGKEEPVLPPPVKIETHKIDVEKLFAATDRARGWMDEHYTIDIGRYTYYYLYSTERYQSFYELLQGKSEKEPKWYNDGYQYLVSTKLPEGGWRGGCGRGVDTAFGVLFLLRSTQKSIQATLGEGTLIAGRGLPTNVAKAKLRGNQIVVEQARTKVEEMLSLIDEAETGRLDDMARDPTSLVVDQVDERSARRLQQLVRGGDPEVRLLAVRALGRSGNLDYVPTLIYALTDPDARVVLEARDGLQFISRRFEGFGPPNDFTEQQRFEAIDAWKRWYRSLRPGALPDGPSK